MYYDEKLSLLKSLPEVVLHIHSQVQPSQDFTITGMPGSPGTEKTTPANLTALDDLDSILLSLYALVQTTGSYLGHEHRTDRDDLRRYNADGAPVGLVALKRDALWTVVSRLSYTLTLWLDDVEASEEFRERFDAFLWEEVAKPCHRWPLEHRGPRAARPRVCPKCDACAVYAAFGDLAMCDECGHTMRAAVWLTISDAAGRVGKTPRTLQRWINDGVLVSQKPKGKRRLVELNSVRALAFS